MESIDSFLNALQAFWDRLAAVHPAFLAAALALSLANLGLRARAWRNIIRAAHPEEHLRVRAAFGAYVAGVGVNAAVPARVGDLVKLFLVHRRVPRASYPTLGATLVAETVIDMFLAGALLVWAIQAGVFPGLPRLPNIPAFELSWAVQHPLIAGGIALGLVLVAAFLTHRARAFWQRFRKGFAIFRTPVRYLRTVASFQMVGWACRLGAAYCFLEAFNVPGSLEAAMIVQVAGSLATLFPATPGGLGPTQALLVVMLAGTASSADVLAFSVGMELSLLVMNVLLAVSALAAMSGRGLRFRGMLDAARAERRAEDASGA